MTQKLKYYSQLLKFRLTSSVVFSAIAGYLLGIDSFSINEFLQLILGGFFVTGSANAFNQILESDFDARMKRTASRPLPQKNITTIEAFFFALIIGFIGLYLLNLINPYGSFFGILSKSSFFGLISILLYVLSYTPLKRLSTISVFVGAIPGAIPFLLGWVAATDDFELIGGTLFAIQFFWQFSHFIAIAWVLDEEYKKAGFKMLFGGKKGTYPAILSILSSVIMCLLSIIPFFWNQEQLMLSLYGFIIITFLGIWFTYHSIVLFRHPEDKNAKKLMLASIAYLPLLQILYIFNKFVS